MAKIIFLGTNGWYDSNTGNTISILIDTTNFYIVLDAGNGIAKLEQYMKGSKPTYLFLSHFHIDHIMGLHTLTMNKLDKGLFLIIQEGGTYFLKQFVNSPFTIPIEELPFKTEIIEVPQNINEIPFKSTFLPMVHSSFTLGIRIEIDGKVITYCPDTGYCENAVTLAEGADLLITECAFRPNQENDSWPHLNPEKAARIASESHSKKLILTHFDAQKYHNFETRKEAEMKAKEIFLESHSSYDGMIIEI